MYVRSLLRTPNPQNAETGRMEGETMSKAEDIGAVSEVDRLIGAVGAGMLDWSETAARMRILAEALRFYATAEN